MTTVLQFCPFSPHLEAGLAARSEVIRWRDREPAARDHFIAEHAGDTGAIITGGHIDATMRRWQPRVRSERGVHVTTTPDVLSDDVADLAVGLLIGLLRAVPAGDAYVRSGRWPGGHMPLGRKVSGRRFEITGLGRMGGAIAARLAPLGPTDARMKVPMPLSRISVR